ncbi:MAG: hypothetical protein HYT65_01770 [Candidatus Yanofskybacteria bacterium]|nr:hypothetical protein [Candidatus Yanofskybacteria bacterium]
MDFIAMPFKIFVESINSFFAILVVCFLLILGYDLAYTAIFWSQDLKSRIGGWVLAVVFIVVAGYVGLWIYETFN